MVYPNSDVFNSMEYERIQDFEKHPLDCSGYRILKYPNGFQVLLISDKKSEISKASMLIGTGILNDPQEFLGLAHFLEHMCFIKSKKYPEVDHFMKFVGNGGGQTNAYTEIDRTCFYFTVSHPLFNEALDIFLNFFDRDMVFDPDYVNREIEAVNSEYVNSKTTDFWRVIHLLQSELKEESGMSQFGTGNSETLRKDGILVALKALHAKYYVASNMTLAISTKEDLDVMEKEIQSYIEPFASQPKENLPQDRSLPDQNTENGKLCLKNSIEKDFDYTRSLFSRSVSSKKAIRAKKYDLLSKKRVLSIFVSLPSFYKNMESNAWFAIENHITNEQPGSLYDLLRRKGLVTELGTYPLLSNPLFTIVEVEFELTSQGSEKVDLIMGAYLKWMEMLNQLEDRELHGFYEETQRLYDVFFNFREVRNGVDQVSENAKNLFYSSPDLFISGIAKISKIDIPKCREMISQFLDTDRILALVSVPDSSTLKDKTEKYYSINYEDFEILPKRDDSLRLSLGRKNEYIYSRDFVPKEPVAIRVPDVPIKQQLLENDRNAEAFLCEDKHFFVPKNYFFCLFESDSHFKSIENYVLTKVLVNLLGEEVSPHLATASKAMYEHAVEIRYTGILIKLHGFNEKMSHFAKDFKLQLGSFIKTGIDALENQQIFNQVEKIKSDLAAFSEAQLRTQALKYFEFLVRSNAFSPLELMKYDVSHLLDSKNITEVKEKLKRLAKSFFAYSKRKIYSHGNMSTEESQELSSLFLEAENHKSHEGDKASKKQKRDLGKGREHIVMNPTSENLENTLVTVVQQLKIEDDDNQVKNNVFTLLLENIISDSFFEILRTQKQMGYAVFCRSFSVENKMFLVYLVQSPSHGLKAIKAEIDRFIQVEAKKIVEELTAEKFESVKKALCSSWNETVQKMKESAHMNWSEIESGEKFWGRKEKLLKFCEEVEVKQFKKVVEKAVFSNSPENRQVLIEIDKKKVDSPTDLEKQRHIFSI